MSDPTNESNQSPTSEDRPQRCPSCGTANRADARWCSNCAQPLGRTDTDASSEARTPAQTYTPPAPPATPPASETKPTPSPTPTPPPPPAPTPTPPPAPPTPAPSTPAPSTPAPAPSPSTTPAAPPPRPAAATPTPAAPASRPESRPPAPATAPGRAAPSTDRRPPPILLALTVLFFITTLVFGWMAIAPSSAPIKTSGVNAAAQVNTEQEIKDVAERFTENLLNYKAATIDADLERAKRDATPEFATAQIPAFGQITLDQVARDVKENNAVSTVTVQTSAVTSRDAETATVIVVTERAIDSATRDARKGLLVVELTLRNTDDGWKVDNAASPTTAN